MFLFHKSYHALQRSQTNKLMITIIRSAKMMESPVKGALEREWKRLSDHTRRLFISASTRYASNFSVSICKSLQRRKNRDMNEGI